MREPYKNERRQVNQKSYELRKGSIEGWYKKERRQDWDGSVRELIDGVVSEELGVPRCHYITPILSHWCRTY